MHIYIYTLIHTNQISYIKRKFYILLKQKKVQNIDILHRVFCQTFVVLLILGYGINTVSLSTQLTAQWCMNHCVKRVRVCGSLTIAALSLIKGLSLTIDCIFQQSFHIYQPCVNTVLRCKYLSAPTSSKINNNLI